MALRCDYCGKGVMHGHNVSHSKRRTKRTFKPNLHKAKVELNGVKKRLRLCTKCLRAFRATKKEKEVKTETAPKEN